MCKQCILADAVVAKSESKAECEAFDEWMLQNVHVNVENGQCECSTPITRCFELRNVFNGNVIYIGCKCVLQFRNLLKYTPACYFNHLNRACVNRMLVSNIDDFAEMIGAGN